MTIDSNVESERRERDEAYDDEVFDPPFYDPNDDRQPHFDTCEEDEGER